MKMKLLVAGLLVAGLSSTIQAGHPTGTPPYARCMTGCAASHDAGLVQCKLRSDKPETCDAIVEASRQQCFANCR